MSKVLVTKTYLDNIASAIRNKLNTNDSYTLPQMASAINSIVVDDENYQTYYVGSTEPDSTLGNNGDIYLMF